MSFKALQSWSPRVRPLDYDSLQQDTGCQDIASGNKWYNSLPFARICIFDHNEDDPLFNPDEKVSYAVGPDAIGDPMIWGAQWVAWSSAVGIRIGKNLIISSLPASSQGAASALYPTTTSDKVSLGFTSGGQIALAIQKTETAIEIKWTDGDDVIQTLSFVGVSPSLFQNGLLYASDDEGETDLAVYYIKIESPSKLFARFERDGFEDEKLVHPKLQVPIQKLFASVAGESRKHYLYALDESGRDVTLRTDEYQAHIDGDASELALSVASGVYEELAQVVELDEDDSTLSLSVVSGIYSDPIQEPSEGTLGPDNFSLALSITSGQYTTP